MGIDDYKKLIADQLQIESTLHREGKYSQIGSEFDLLHAQYPDQRVWELAIAINFWEAWSDDAAHGFPGFSTYSGIKKEDWPILAAGVIAGLNGKTPFPAIVVEKFDRSKRQS